jgi:O-acetyl-ADP-ribose deacetylase (regulator of RNase III)
LASDAEALVNPVNTVGVSGKGLALHFANAFPDAFYAYKARCQASLLKLGMVWSWPDKKSKKLIVFFPTKGHFRERSHLDSVIDGLEELRKLIERKRIQSVAVPALGCGLGGLSWEKVKPEIEKALGHIEGCNVQVYEPR